MLIQLYNNDFIATDMITSFATIADDDQDYAVRINVIGGNDYVISGENRGGNETIIEAKNKVEFIKNIVNKRELQIIKI